MISRLVMLSSVAGLMIACSRPQAETDVQSSLDANAASTGHLEWEASDAHPERVFEKWRVEKRDDKEICKALLSRKSDELTVFEDEIQKDQNKMLVSDCRTQLVDKIESYWTAETDKASRISLDFRFPEIVKRQDFSQGLLMINAGLKTKEVMLTFDDGPHATNTDVILSTLRKAGLKVIFFEMGRNVRHYPEITKRVAADGHGIGSHSMTHACLPATRACAKNNGHMLSYVEATNEITGGHEEIYKVLGWVDPFFRFPYGASSIDLKKFVAERSVGEFFWSIDSNDWKNRSPGDVVNGVMNDLHKNGDRGLVLMHDIQRRTAIALPTLLSRLHDEGYTVVTVRPASEQERFHSKMAGPERIKFSVPMTSTGSSFQLRHF